MNVLITGVLGMVGSHMLDFLLEKTDIKIYGFCRWNESMDNIEHLIDIINKKGRIELIYGDLNDYPSIVNAIEISKPNYVFHLGAQSYPQTSFDSPIETLQTNIIGTANLLEGLRKSKYKDALIHICASSEVFGRVPKEKLPIDEECSFHPASPYAISKAGVLQLTKTMALELARYSIRVNALLPGYIATDLNRAFLQSEAGEKLRARIPSRRFGEVNDLNGPILLLASDASQAMSGTSIAVDGAAALEV